MSRALARGKEMQGGNLEEGVSDIQLLSSSGSVIFFALSVSLCEEPTSPSFPSLLTSPPTLSQLPTAGSS